MVDRYRAQADGSGPVYDTSTLLEYATRPRAMLAYQLTRPNDTEPRTSPRVISFLRRLRRRYMTLLSLHDTAIAHLEALRKQEEAFTNLAFGEYSANGLPLLNVDEPDPAYLERHAN